MYVWPPYRFAFLCVPATGSVTVARALMRSGAYCLSGHHDRPPDHVGRLAELGYDETWTTACAVRSIPNWFRSMYRKGILGQREAGPITVEWIRRLEADRRWFEPHARDPFVRFTAFATDVWHQETLQADLAGTLVRIGAPRLVLEVWNVTDAPHVDFTPGALAYIHERYRHAQAFVS